MADVRQFSTIWGITLMLMDGRGLVGIGGGRGRVVFDGEMAWMLGKRRCRNIEVAGMGLDGRFRENATWKMTAVERSVCC